MRKAKRERLMSELYAGKIILKPAAVARLRIRDRYSLHRMVLDLYPHREGDAKETSVRDVQWADRGEHLAGREVLLLSNRPPMTEDLPDDVRVMVKKLPDSFLEHATYRIRMDVNPCRCVDGRHQAVPRGELENWLHDKAKRSGFAFTHLQIGRYGATRFTKEGHRVTFAELRVDGIVRVLDADLFKQTVANGFGRGKAFGYGLMQIIPLSLQ